MFFLWNPPVGLPVDFQFCTLCFSRSATLAARPKSAKCAPQLLSSCNNQHIRSINKATLDLHMIPEILLSMESYCKGFWLPAVHALKVQVAKVWDYMPFTIPDSPIYWQVLHHGARSPPYADIAVPLLPDITTLVNTSESFKMDDRLLLSYIKE